MPEGLRDRGKKTLAGIIEFIYRAVITIAIFLWIKVMFYISHDGNLYVLLAGYVLLRYALFDYIYNLCAGQTLFFTGTTKLFDKFWNWFFRVTKFPKDHFFFMTKLIAFLIGITFLIRG
jgi:hypothetical protein